KDFYIGRIVIRDEIIERLKPGVESGNLRDRVERLDQMLKNNEMNSSIDGLIKREKINVAENEMIELFGMEKIIIISDTPGMGKTTVLSSLSRKIKAMKPNHWVIRIDLNDHTEVLDEEAEK